MYHIATPTGETHLTEKITYVRQHSSGVFLITNQKHAEGINYHGVNYVFAEGAQLHEVDAFDVLTQEDAKNREAVEQELTDQYLDGIQAQQDITDIQLQLLGG